MTKWTTKSLAQITGGIWEVPPLLGWSTKRLAFTEELLEANAVVIPLCKSYRYGVKLKAADRLPNSCVLLVDNNFSASSYERLPRLRVSSVRVAVEKLATAARAEYAGRIIAVTGSVGKTTSVRMIAEVLQSFGISQRPTVNFNTYDGVHGEVANLDDETVSVVEVAASFLARAPAASLRPHVSVITTIGDAHLEKFGSREGIAKVKSKIFGLSQQGTAVVPRDSEFFELLTTHAQDAGAKVISFGSHRDSEARLLAYSDSFIDAEIFGERIRYRLGVRGRHMAVNSLGALAAIAAVELDWRKAAAVLEAMTAVTGRGTEFVVELQERSFLIIDDSYNANPTSIRSALETLSERPVAGSGRRIAVLADMLELGSESEHHHRALAEDILRCRIDRVYLAGPLMRSLWEVLPSKLRGQYFAAADNVWPMLSAQISQGDIVLFKGSHGTNLHITVGKIRQAASEASDYSRAYTKQGLQYRRRTQRNEPTSAQAGSAIQISLAQATGLGVIKEAEDASPRHTIVFVGDTSLGDAYLASERRAAERLRLEKHPWSFFEALVPLIEDRSILIANLETVLAEAPADPFAGRKGYQGWDKPERTLSILKQLGVDAVSLANNHTMDFGPTCLTQTISYLHSAGIQVVGAGNSEAMAARPLSCTGLFGNVHIFAGFEYRDRYAHLFRFYAAQNRPGVNAVTHGPMPTMAQAIARKRTDDPQSVIIAFPHWGGPSNYDWANEEMSVLNSQLLASGADLVIGHGSHSIQEFSSTQEGTTIFSLGNFVFNSPGRYKKHNAPPYSVVARLDLARGREGWGGKLRLYPIVSDNRLTGFRPRPVSRLEADTVYRLLRSRPLSVPEFATRFVLEQDRRGWFIAPSLPLSPRIALWGEEDQR
jgi:UDP-N-acetylmuramoyl-tripeptide--D-alanyl-D-alanine ligase